MKKRTTHKLFSLLLTLVMVLGMLPMTAFAAELDSPINLQWDEYKATWTYPGGYTTDDRLTIYLYKDGTFVRGGMYAYYPTAEFDLSDEIELRGDGTYTFVLNYGSGESDTSPELIVEDISTPTVTGISVYNSGKTSYFVGDSLSVSGVKINVIRSNGSTQLIGITADMVSGFDSSQATASQTLTITYEGQTTNYTIVIKEPLDSPINLQWDEYKATWTYPSGYTTDDRLTIYLYKDGTFVRGGMYAYYPTAEFDLSDEIKLRGDGTYTFVLNYGSGESDTSPELATSPSTTYAITMTNGKASIGAGTPITAAAKGTLVTITANTPASGEEFDKWVVVSGNGVNFANANSDTTTFTMPANAVFIRATYKTHTHSYGSWTQTNAPTCTEKGEETRSCDCGHKETRDVAANGHDFVRDTQRDVAATTTETGIEAYSCSRCDATDDKTTEMLKEIEVEETAKLKKLEGKFIAIASDLTKAEFIKLLPSGVVLSEDKGEDVLYTGMTVALKDENSNPIDTLTVIVMGDVDGNGKVQAADARLALRQSVGLENLDEIHIKAALVAGATKLAAAQARLILRASVGLETAESLLAQ